MTNSIQALTKIEIYSFSYKDPLPDKIFSWEEERHGGGFVFDCRALPNPGRDPRFASCTGRDKEVVDLLESDSTVREFINSTEALVKASVSNYITRGFTHLSVGFGCTGGQHRSVYSAEHLTRALQDHFKESVTVTCKHYSLEKKGLL